MLTILLASCTAQVEDKKDTASEEPQNTAVDSELESMMNETLKEMEKGVEEMKNSDMDENKVEKLTYSYSNDAQEVNMNIEYKLDSDNKISSVSIVSDNYDLS
jgi:molecular chaperone DnaK (HSP70)